MIARRFGKNKAKTKNNEARTTNRSYRYLVDKSAFGGGLCRTVIKSEGVEEPSPWLCFVAVVAAVVLACDDDARCFRRVVAPRWSKAAESPRREKSRRILCAQGGRLEKLLARARCLRLPARFAELSAVALISQDLVLRTSWLWEAWYRIKTAA